MRRVQTKHLVLVTLNALVWSLVALSWSGTVKFSAVKRVEVELTTSPSRVRLLIDGAPYEGGGYLTTPAVIRFLPGKHRITIQRTGYHSNSSTIVASMADPIAPIQTVLEAIANNLQSVEIETANGEEIPNLDVSLDGGLEVGKLPLLVEDLLPGIHILEIKSGFISKSVTRCQFEVPTTPAAEPIKIILEQSGKRLRINGCKRIKN